MTDRELMQQALEALETCSEDEWYNDDDFGMAQVYDEEKITEAITALRERLAQPEQEPVAWISKHGVVYPLDAKDEVHPINDIQPLYTTPPRREWVGLTDEEIKAMPQWFPSHETAAAMPLIRAIEAKLKEKNA